MGPSSFGKMVSSLAAGRHLDASGENIEIPLGLGSRHRAAAGITSLTDALAIVISEETGGVRIFHHGKIFMEIEKGSRRNWNRGKME